MKKFEVKSDVLEFNPDKLRTPGEIFDHYLSEDNDSKRIALCDTLEEAKAILAAQTPYIQTHSCKLASGTVYYIEEGEWECVDGEWRWIDGCDICEYSIAPLRQTADLSARDFEVLKPARSSDFGGEEGYIVRYNGDLYFIHSDRLNIDEFELWCEIERSWCIEEYDPEDRYYEIDGILRPLNLDI